jgi:YesN/AraC family two-component response regulator
MNHLPGQNTNSFIIKLPINKDFYKDSEIKEDKNQKNLKGIKLLKEREKEQSYSPTSQKFKILIIDDNIEIMNFLIDLFSEYKCYSAFDGQEALDIVKSNNIDLIISDDDMPNINGEQFLRQIKKDRNLSFIPFIFIPNNQSRTLKQQIISIGADDSISKPINVKILKTKVQSLLKNREMIKTSFKAQLLSQPNVLVPDNLNEEFILKISKIIHSEMHNQEFNVQKLVEKTSYSQSTLYKKIKTITGMSAVEFIRKIRLSKAEKLLRNKDLSIAEIMHQVGISDHKYFRESFKKVFGKSPKKYRDALN